MGMIESILIKDVDMVFDSQIRHGDIFIENGKIQDVADRIHRPAEVVINEKGLTALPGIIDTHVHFREPGLTHKEDFSSGSKAAVAGGITSILDMPNTLPPATTSSLIQEKKKCAAQKSLVNYNFLIGATADNLEELNTCENIAGIKLFMGSSTGNLLVDNLKDIEKIIASGTRLIAVHAESQLMIEDNKKKYPHPTIFDHEKIRNAKVALTALTQIVELALKYTRPLHILHVSSEEEVAYLQSKALPNNITAEVTPQHLSFASPKIYEMYNTLAKINPPIRSENHRHALWKALKAGVIQTIATDHAPHTLTEKKQSYDQAPSGMPIIEQSLPLLLNAANQNQCTLIDIAKWMSENPAKIYKLASKGKIQMGYDADLVLIDLKTIRKVQNEKLHTKSQWSILNQKTLQGWPIITIVNGNIVYREGDIFDDIKGKELVIK